MVAIRGWQISGAIVPYVNIRESDHIQYNRPKNDDSSYQKIHEPDGRDEAGELRTSRARPFVVGSIAGVSVEGEIRVCRARSRFGTSQKPGPFLKKGGPGQAYIAIYPSVTPVRPSAPS